MIFCRFLTKKIQTRSPAERKNDFHIKILLETCSATSNYPWNWLSCHQDMYCGLYMKKFKKLEQMRPFSALFGGGLLQFLHTLWKGYLTLYQTGLSCVHLESDRKIGHIIRKLQQSILSSPVAGPDVKCNDSKNKLLTGEHKKRFCVLKSPR